MRRIDRKQIRSKVPKGWLIVWEGIKRYGSIVHHTTIQNEKTGIEFVLYHFDIPEYTMPVKKIHPITGKCMYCGK